MHNGAEVLVALAGMAGVFGWIPILIYTKHKYRMEELKAQRGGLAGEGLAELRALRAEVDRLRETSTRFDVAFDESLSRLEQRVDRVEVAAGANMSVPDDVYASTRTRVSEAESTQETQTLGRRSWM